jgi:hypothetical protein
MATDKMSMQQVPALSRKAAPFHWTGAGAPVEWETESIGNRQRESHGCNTGVARQLHAMLPSQVGEEGLFCEILVTLWACHMTVLACMIGISLTHQFMLVGIS